MDYHIKEYFQSFNETPRGNFHAVVALHEAPDVTWKCVCDKVPDLPRGWFELAQLPSKDRIEFTRDFWLQTLPYTLGLDTFIERFFNSLDDIGVFVTQKIFEGPFEANVTYSLKDNRGFFRGGAPIKADNQARLEEYFINFTIPAGYLAFLHIHDGFWKTTDCTGITKSIHMAESYERFQASVEEILMNQGTRVNPKTLIPFYESFGMPFYQCFWGDWYPEHEMGNVYYSGETKTISDVSMGANSSETLAFPTFVDWLMFYLEGIE